MEVLGKNDGYLTIRRRGAMFLPNVSHDTRRVDTRSWLGWTGPAGTLGRRGWVIVVRSSSSGSPATLALALPVPMLLPGHVPDGLAAGHVTTVTTFDPSLGQLPEGLAIDRTGNAYLSMAPLGELWRIEPGGVPAPVAGTEVIGLPNGVTFDNRGNLYVTSSFEGMTAGAEALGSVAHQPRRVSLRS